MVWVTHPMLTHPLQDSPVNPPIQGGFRKGVTRGVVVDCTTPPLAIRRWVDVR